MFIYKQETSDWYRRREIIKKGFNWEFPHHLRFLLPHTSSAVIITNSLQTLFSISSIVLIRNILKHCFQGHVAEGVDWDHQKVKREYHFLHCFQINHPLPLSTCVHPSLATLFSISLFKSAHIFIFSLQPRLCRPAFNAFPFSFLQTCPAKL